MDRVGETGVVAPRPLVVQAAGHETAARFARLAVELHDSGGLEETVQAVVEFALQALNCSYAGVALVVRGRRLKIPAVTHPVVAEIYEFQVGGGCGPLVDSLRDHSIVLIRDTATDQR